MKPESSLECRVCGAEVTDKDAVKLGDQVFCSKACADRAQPKGPPPPQPTP